jgi:uracil-DNA glycosylase family 4
MGAAGDTFAPEAPKLCSRCPRLVEFRDDNQRKHPDWFNGAVPSFGDLGARLLIVGLAPGLNGANRTGRPFTGDYAGDLLYSTLLQFGFARGRYDARTDDGFELVDCIISNSVRCVPPQNKPTPQEINTCCGFLRSRLGSLPNVRVMVALGRIAHDSALTALGCRKSQYPFAHAAHHELPGGVRLIDSFHCSRYNTNTRRLTEEMFHAVFADVRNFLAATPAKSQRH